MTATTQLQLYNDALAMVGERSLASLSEEVETRRQLDRSWNSGAVDYCLEMIKPKFATIVSSMVAAAVPTDLGFNFAFNLPADYVAMVRPYSDSTIDEPITRYVIQARQIVADHNPIFLRYVSNSATAGGNLDIWSASFAKFVSSFLATDIVARIRPDAATLVQAAYAEALKVSLERDKIEEQTPHSKPKTTTLTLDWLQIYNDALFCMGAKQLITINDDSDTRATLDAVVNQGAVKFLLEDIQWSWANSSTQIDYDISIEPEFGYIRAFDKPADMYRLAGMFSDEYFRCPLKDYADEDTRWFTDIDTIYVQYVSNAMINSPQLWPMYFRKLVAAYIAQNSAASLGGNIETAVQQYTDRYRSAQSNDAQASPPRRIAEGSWTKARLTGGRSYYRGRP